MKQKMLCGFLIGTLACAGSALGAPGVIAADQAGNYTVTTFTNGSNLGTGFGAWDLWNKLAELGDSTAGGGGDLNSTNGYSFRFMGDGAGGWCNGKRNIAAAMQTGDVLSFTFTYNWDGGGRGVDIFCATGQFANLIDVSPGNTFKVNQAVVSTLWSPSAVVAVDITQLANGIQVHLTRTTNGVENLNYTTNILNADPATGFSLYCGGYTCAPADNVNYAIFMNDIQIVGEPRRSLVFADGTWNPKTVGPYEYTLTRDGAVSNLIALVSSNTNAVQVPASVSFAAGSNTVVFTANVVSLTNGDATITATDSASGATATYDVKPVPPQLYFGGPWEVYTAVPAPIDYTLTRVGAVGSNIVLVSTNSAVMQVTNALTFADGQTNVSFQAKAVGYGTTALVASNVASGVAAEYIVAVKAPALKLTGPTTVEIGENPTYTLTRFGPIGDTVALSSTNVSAMTVPASVDFPFGQNTVTFQGTTVAAGITALNAANDDAAADPLAVTVVEALSVLAYDEAGNYTLATFTNTSNLGYGFGAWDLWNTPATLGDSTAGGGGNLNSTNGFSFRFMGDGAGGWCNGKRNFAGPLNVGDVLSFTFTYNWDGGGRGVDVFSQSGQFANLINVVNPDVFQVNGTTISSTYSPGAVVDVKITQLADGIQMNLSRSVGGVENLNYSTNILNAEPATGISIYCGGYTCAPADNVNYAIFMNDLTIRGIPPTALTFSAGTWNPSSIGPYLFELTRSGEVGTNVVLSSSNTNSVTVPPSVNFDAGANKVSFYATVLSLTNGEATIVATNAASGKWAEYVVKPFKPANPPIAEILYNPALDTLTFAVPAGYTLVRVEGANALSGQAWDWTTLSAPADYEVVAGVVTVKTTAAAKRMIRIVLQ